MPYKSEKIQIEGTKLDRRIKLTPEQKDKIASLRGVISLRSCARMYKVDKRTIQFIWYPERLERNKQLCQERGGWKQYYDKIKWRATMKEHRNYKQELFFRWSNTMTEWDYIFERDWNKYSINAILERKKKDDTKNI